MIVKTCYPQACCKLFQQVVTSLQQSCNKPDFNRLLNLMKLTSLFPLVKKLYKLVKLITCNNTRKVKVLSLPETIKEKSTFRAKALRRELVEVGPSLETSIFPLSFQIVREPLPFAYH